MKLNLQGHTIARLQRRIKHKTCNRNEKAKINSDPEDQPTHIKLLIFGSSDQLQETLRPGGVTVFFRTAKVLLQIVTVYKLRYPAL